jgi:hypothetical protein
MSLPLAVLMVTLGSALAGGIIFEVANTDYFVAITMADNMILNLLIGSFNFLFLPARYQSQP